MPMYVGPEACPACGAAHPFPSGGFEHLGDHDCPGCGKANVFHVEWETEVDLEPVDPE